MVSHYLIPMIYEFVIFSLTGMITFQVGKRLYEKRNNVIKFMFFFTLMMAFANLSAAISRILRLTNLWELQDGQYLELLALTVIFIAISNIFLLMFGLEIFHAKITPANKKILIGIYSGLVCGFSVFSLWKGLFVVDLTTSIWAILVILSLLVDVYIIFASFRLIPKLDETKDKFFVRFIAFSPIILIFIYIFFMMDIIFGGNFTIFYYLGWFAALMADVSLAIGVLRPEFIEKRLDTLNS